MRFCSSVFSLGALLVSLSASATFTLVKQPDLKGELNINPEALCQVADNTLKYLDRYADDDFAVHSGKVFPETVSLERVKETLIFLCQPTTQQQLGDMGYLSENFEFYRWTPDKKQASAWAERSNNEVKSRLLNNIPNDQILLTKYYTKLLDASAKQTTFYSQALYALPFDEQELSIEQAQLQQDKLTRFRFTRQEIVNGALLKNQLAQPLVWLSEEALHDVLLQGTGVVKIGDDIRYFNVHRNNGIAYDYTKGKREQQRYWYFAEVPSILGYGKTIESKIAILPDVSFAGNVASLGLGKLFVIKVEAAGKQQTSLGILADQGGAFDNNLFQLDWLKGSYYGWQDYYQANKHYSDYASAWLMLKKQQQ
ncbi:MltA domain-containing protein [Thalassotalea ganghwensis]